MNRRTSHLGRTSVQLMRKFGQLATVGLLALSLVSIGSAQVPTKDQNPKPVPKPRPLPPTPPRQFQVPTGSWRSGYSPYPGVTISRGRAFNRYVDYYIYNAPIELNPFYYYPSMPPFIQYGAYPGDADNVDQTNSVVQLISSPGQDSDPVSVPKDPSTSVPPVKKADPDAAVSDLKNAWTSTNLAIIDRLTPKKGQVRVSVADESYDLDANDFYQLLSDGVSGTKTISWKIVDEHVDGDQITLQAIHTFEDPWGKERAISQTYTLKQEGASFVIRSFGSEPYVQPSNSEDDSQG